MTEYGTPIVEEMVKDLNKSLLIMSASQPKRRWGSLTTFLGNRNFGHPYQHLHFLLLQYGLVFAVLCEWVNK